MASTFKGYDPELGRKFAEESNGFVIGRRKSSPKVLTPEKKLQRAVEESPFRLDAQQQHDAMMGDN